jgi:hypothetical protein
MGRLQLITYEHLKRQGVNFERLTGVKLSYFTEIARRVRPDWDKLQALKKISGRKSHLQTLEDEI